MSTTSVKSTLSHASIETRMMEIKEEEMKEHEKVYGKILLQRLNDTRDRNDRNISNLHKQIELEEDEEIRAIFEQSLTIERSAHRRVSGIISVASASDSGEWMAPYIGNKQTDATTASDWSSSDTEETKDTKTNTGTVVEEKKTKKIDKFVQKWIQKTKSIRLNSAGYY